MILQVIEFRKNRPTFAKVTVQVKGAQFFSDSRCRITHIRDG